LKRRLSGLPFHPEGSHAGFGYPLCEHSVLRPSEASFSSQRSWASPFRALLLLGDRSDRYRPDLPLLRFTTTSRPCTDAPAGFSHRESRAPLCHPED
jgi:hypothetical protein